MDSLSLLHVWLIVGFLMLVIEMFSLSFFAFFIAVGALITALLAYLGILPNLTLQIIVFAVSSVLSLIFLRKIIKEKFSRVKGKEYSEFIGEVVKVTRTIPANGSGKILFRGTEWEAKSEDNAPRNEGEQVTIVRMDGIAAIVK